MEKAKNIIENDEILNSVKKYVDKGNIYVVGGYVRDALMGKVSVDRDLIVDCDDVRGVSQFLADKLDAYFVPLDEVNKIYRIVLKDKINYLDITSPVENDLEKDLKRRDLALNSVAYDIKKAEFVDISGGIQDIKNKVIRGISEGNFVDDPLRILRVYRFYSKLGFEIDDELFKITKKHVLLINNSAKERIATELLKLFEGFRADDAILKMDEIGLVDILFPIMKDVKKVPPNLHHHLDLFHHSVESVRQVQQKYKEANVDTKSYLDKIDYGVTSNLGYLKLSAFLHDIGKPQTWTIEEDTERHRFIKHDDVGSKLAVPILKDLKLSKKQISHITNLIKYHIYPSTLTNQGEVSYKAQMRFFRKMEGSVVEVIFLAMADRLSARGVEITDEIVEKNISGLKNLLNIYMQTKEEIKPLPKLLNGKEIMELLKIPQSKVLGEIIKQLKEAQISGDVETREDAISFVKNINA
ncbi:MAG: HD domain-containing protein [Candidatus Gastranaerophilales bacterium]|nr:HD domain-containing protein [Candidatus Gastranaerophilales bacterium]